MVQLLDLIFPKFCVGCGRIGSHFCIKCQKQIHHIEQWDTICPVCEKGAIDGLTHPGCKTLTTLDGLVSFFHYDQVIKKAVKEIKYRFVSDVAGTVISLIDDCYLQQIHSIKNSVFVPIPLHVSRQRERGFNQAAVIAMLFAKRLNFPVIYDMLVRIQKTTPQVAMHDRKQRLQNMKQVFAFNEKYRGQIPSTVILVDDVFTTGATLSSACGILKQAGVKTVIGLTIAR